MSDARSHALSHFRFFSLSGKAFPFPGPRPAFPALAFPRFAFRLAVSRRRLTSHSTRRFSVADSLIHTPTRFKLHGTWQTVGAKSRCAGRRCAPTRSLSARAPAAGTRHVGVCASPARPPRNGSSACTLARDVSHSRHVQRESPKTVTMQYMDLFSHRNVALPASPHT